MSRSVVKWGLAVLLGGAALAGTAGPAPAQVISVPNPLTGGTFNYTRYRTMSLNFMTPMGPFSYQSTYYGAPRVPVIGPTYRTPYMSGGFGWGAGPNVGAVQQQQQHQKDLARMQKRGAGTWAGGVEARTAITDQLAYEKGSKGVVGPVNPAKLPVVNKALFDPGPADVASGKALNDLLAAVRPLEEKAVRAADAPLLQPDLYAHIQFAGGPSADALNVLRAGALEFPAALNDSRFDQLRSDLTREYTLLQEASTQNRATVVGAADRVLAAVRRSRDATLPAVREMAYQDAFETARMFNRLEAAAKFLRDPTAAAAYVPAWGNVGLTVKELVRHMGRHKLAFGPAGPADLAAYDVVHRDLVNYYLALAQVQPTKK